MSSLPDGLISYGPDANCTLELCPVSSTVYQYRPSLAASGTYIALFGVAMFLHIWRGVVWREWTFMGCMVAGCIAEMIGYGGRIILYHNPFSFDGFLMQIICITVAPVFYCAAIYILLARITLSLGRRYSYLRPSLYYLIFLPCDIVSLILQATGGALSSTSSGEDQSGVDISLAGLSIQVITLFCFGVACISYFWRYHKDRANPDRTPLPRGFTVWAVFLALAIVCIFIRCAYRIEELKEGYTGTSITNEPLFIALEGAVIVVAVYALLLAHPGPVFNNPETSAAQQHLSSAPASDHEITEKTPRIS